MAIKFVKRTFKAIFANVCMTIKLSLQLLWACQPTV